MKKFIIFLMIIFCFSASYAQETPSINISKTNEQLDKIIRQLNSGKIEKQKINDFLDETSTILEQISQIKQHHRQEGNIIQKKLDALGAPPTQGTKETAIISKQRKEINEQAEKNKTELTQIDLINAKIDEINSLILKIRNKQLLDNILVKQSSIFQAKEFWQSLTTFYLFLLDIIKSPLSWYNELPLIKQDTVKENLTLTLFSVFIITAFAYILSIYIKRWFGYKKNIERPDYSQKLKAAIGMFIAKGVIPAAVISTFLFWLQHNELFSTGAFSLLLNNAAFYFLYYYLVKASIKVIFTAKRPKWRIIDIDNEKSQKLSSALVFSAATICIVSFFQNLANEMNYDASIIYAIKTFANAVKAFCIIFVSFQSLYNPPNISTDDNEDTITELNTSSKFAIYISVIVCLTFCISLLGYIRLSEYILDRIILSAIAIGTIYIIKQLLKTIIRRILLMRFWVKTLRISRRKLLKTEFWLNLFLTPIIWILTLLVILALWGVSVDILLTKTKRFLVGFNIGGIHISISSIILGIFCFYILLSFFKMLKNSLIEGNLSKIEMSDGLRSSLISSLNFLGFIISGIIAIAIMGGSLESLAIIAGALSFGIGLGLQNMVSNFAAGMTILWERPIKIGDWVIINNMEGIVKQINMRSTEIENSENSTIIIPNSDILSKSLINHTYNGRSGRVSLKINLDYNNDIKKIRNTLLDIAATNTDIAPLPAPTVTCSKLSDQGMEFSLNCFLNNVFTRPLVLNDLREKIVESFKIDNINTPISRQNIYIEQDN